MLRIYVKISGSIIETGDWVATLGTEYLPTVEREKYLTLKLVKRRRTEHNPEMEKYNYLAHPFSKHNGFRLIDDIYLNKVLSLDSLATDIDLVPKEKSNAIQRIQYLPDKDDDFI